jgi:ferredoxin-NADP reductase
MQLSFESTRPETSDIMTFAFRPAAKFTWIAGQSIKIEVPGPYGPLEHRFSISSAPCEGVIAITTRLSGSSYKNSLARLTAGDRVQAYGLEGDFTWRKSETPHIFVAAGIGITPFRAMFTQRAHEKQPLAATLIYASSREHLFKSELDDWQKTYPEFTVSYLTGRRVTADDIPKDTKQLMYISGPSLMVDELSVDLLAQGVAEEQLVRDWFTGRLPAEG